jgi:hypothetical protein
MNADLRSMMPRLAADILKYGKQPFDNGIYPTGIGTSSTVRWTSITQSEIRLLALQR